MRIRGKGGEVVMIRVGVENVKKESGLDENRRSSSWEDNDSSNLHIRQKRVINIRKQGDGPVTIGTVPYIVNIRRDNISECAGTILSAVHILTPYQCVYPASLERYTILSESAMRNSGYLHTIKKRTLVEPNKRLALIEVSPDIDFHFGPNRPIRIFSGVIPHIVYGIFSGWGCTVPGAQYEHEPQYPNQLMQVRLPIISLEECIRIYWGRATITNRNICTLDTSLRRGTCIGDLGGPLVLRIPPLYVPELVGIMSVLRAREFGKYPDVFTSLNHLDIYDWISDEIQHNV
ncbi:trypsin-like [Belonocnema kinseyi]|uniref:trypsin-like n=1 Tax=Belonocnema kinseyi TaxID=2817044 RepID=UPI00143D7E10|nr:trypsin-like [Belonocnema kinseyi]